MTLEHALDVLLDDDLEPIVEMVLSRDDGGYEARAADGRVRFRRHDDGHGWRFDVEGVEGRNPLGDQAIDRFAGLDAERAARFPDRTRNAYPFAYEMVAQLFDAPSPPDVCVVHTAAHNWEEAGGHRGEHGSLDAVQSRAPFIIGGAGVRAARQDPARVPADRRGAHRAAAARRRSRTGRPGPQRLTPCRRLPAPPGR